MPEKFDSLLSPLYPPYDFFGSHAMSVFCPYGQILDGSFSTGKYVKKVTMVARKYTMEDIQAGIVIMVSGHLGSRDGLLQVAFKRLGFTLGFYVFLEPYCT